MPAPLMVFRVGYMERYDGPDEIQGGGAHVDEHGVGGEMWNFLPEGGRCFGYVMIKGFGGLNLKRLAKPTGRKWASGDELNGVDIVFVAQKPGGKQVVVGWYLGATVYHRQYRKRPNRSGLKGWAKLHYLCDVLAENAVLLDENDRTFEVPYAPVHGKGYHGNSNIWYGDGSSENTSKLIAKLRRYIKWRSAKIGTRNTVPAAGGGGWGRPLDKATLLAIEEASMEAVEAHFSANGYSIDDIHTANLGWDLTAKRAREVLFLEVKGHLGEVIQFELTPNEFSKLKQHHPNYRVCVVRKALKRSDVEVFTPHLIQGGGWELRGPKGSVVKLSERVAAQAMEIK